MLNTYGMDDKVYFVYIMASQKNGTLYIGVTNALYARVGEHKSKSNPKSFTSKHGVDRLVYFEQFEDINTAIDREKFLKKQTRAYKIKRIEKDNPNWSELYHRLSDLLL